MTATDNTALVRRYVEISDTDRTKLDEVLATNFTWHMGSQPDMNLASSKQFINYLYTAFPDMRHDIENIVTEGDMAAVRVTVRGTHKAEFNGVAATGKKFEVMAAFFIRIENGKIAEEWGVFDAMTLMQQLGAIPGK